MAKQRRGDSHITRESSASKMLSGLEYRGKRIKSVWVVGTGARRVIAFSDGSTEKTSKNKIASLARIKGTLSQLGKYRELSRSGRRAALAKSRGRQATIRDSTVLKLVEKLARARTTQSRRALKGRIQEIMKAPIESPLVTGRSILDAGRKRGVRRHVDALKNVRWVTVRRGGRTVRLPVEEKRWVLKLKASKKRGRA